jgi:UDP-N-acetylglucosamine acyltransferase
MAKNISPQAIVHSNARLADNVEIGPWTLIGEDVEIAEGTVVASHVVIKGPTRIGRNNQIYQFSSIGEDTQDMKYHGEKTRLEIGDNNIIREYVSIHRGTSQDRGVTSIGDSNLFITSSHVAHDCQIGNHTIIGHNVGLAGHVTIEDYAIVTSYAAVHQFCTVGAHGFLGRATMLVKDMPPYMLVAGGFNAAPVGINVEGLKRRGFSSESIDALRRAYKIIYRESKTSEEAVSALKEMVLEHKAVQPLIDFLQKTERGIVR